MNQVPTPPSKMTKEQLKIMAFKQRVGELSSDYEDRITNMMADYHQQIEAYQDTLRTQEDELESLRAQLRKYQDEEKDVQVKEDGKSTDTAK